MSFPIQFNQGLAISIFVHLCAAVSFHINLPVAPASISPESSIRISMMISQPEPAALPKPIAQVAPKPRPVSQQQFAVKAVSKPAQRAKPRALPEPEPIPAAVKQPDPAPVQQPEHVTDTQPERILEPEPEITEVITKPVVNQPSRSAQHISNQTIAADADRLAILEAEYRNQVLDRIEAHKFYPKRARKMRKEGQVLLEFSLQRDGRLHTIAVVESEGHSILRNAAVKAVEHASLFPGFPEHIKKDYWSFRTRLEYRLR